MKTRTPLFFSLFLFCTLALHAAATLPQTHAAAAKPVVKVNGRQEGEKRRAKDTHVRTCEEVGLCDIGEKRLLLGSKSPKEIFSALLKGCRSKRWLNNDVVLECPEDVLIPGATTERVFKTQDFFSVQQVNAYTVHQQDIKGSGVKVAVLDTGINATHPEISSRIVGTYSFVSGSTVADGNGHGTHVAGIVAGAGSVIHADENGDNRILGTSPQVDLLIGKVCSDEGWCAEGDILAGIEWAVNQGAKVINLSVGGGAFTNSCDSDALAEKANWAANQGTLVVAASGNGAETAVGVSTPGCASKAVAVGAVDRSNVRQTWSGNGPLLDVMAPGLGILSSLPCAVSATCPEAGYGWWSGTSMASPHVAGLAALIRGVNTSLTADETRGILTATAYDLGNAGFDDSYGYGRVNATTAIARAKDFDNDGSLLPLDCNDRDATVSPLKSEACGNGVDDDCDGLVDEGCVSSSSSSSSSFVSSVSSVSSASSASSVSSASSTSSSSLRSSSSRSSSSRSSSSRSPCDEPQKAFGELVREFEQLRTNWGRFRRCDIDKTEELTTKMKSFSGRNPSCFFELPNPIEPCNKETICASMKIVFENLLRDYEKWRCLNQSWSGEAEQKFAERVREQVKDVLEKYPDCGFSLPEYPACSSFSSSSKSENSDQDDDEDDEDDRTQNTSGERR